MNDYTMIFIRTPPGVDRAKKQRHLLAWLKGETTAHPRYATGGFRDAIARLKRLGVWQ
jgi:hypothetical protein